MQNILTGSITQKKPYYFFPGLNLGRISRWKGRWIPSTWDHFTFGRQINVCLQLGENSGIGEEMCDDMNRKDINQPKISISESDSVGSRQGKASDTISDIIYCLSPALLFLKRSHIDMSE